MGFGMLHVSLFFSAETLFIRTRSVFASLNVSQNGPLVLSQRMGHSRLAERFHPDMAFSQSQSWVSFFAPLGKGGLSPYKSSYIVCNNEFAPVGFKMPHSILITCSTHSCVPLSLERTFHRPHSKKSGPRFSSPVRAAETPLECSFLWVVNRSRQKGPLDGRGPKVAVLGSTKRGPLNRGAIFLNN